MKMFKVFLGVVLALGFVAVSGCKKSQPAIDVAAPLEYEGVKVELPKLNQKLEGMAEQQSTARNVQMAFRYRQYEKALMEMDKLANDPALNDEQKKLAAEVLEQVKQVVQKAPPPAQ